jgi:stearoyl-CoA desaturase (delta-9 desaturase)
MRFWLWLTTGMVTNEWVAVHRKHHQSSDSAGDPHSPRIYGIWKVLFGGAFLYAKAKKDPNILKLGIGTPNDWIEKNVYSKYNILGIIILLILNVILFNSWGILIWLIQMIWVPLHAAGIVNGLCHWWGYRNFDTKDSSRNLLPWGIWIGGEELHNSHHGDGTNPKFSKHWWEFDIGWMYIVILRFFRLASVR